LQWSFEPLHIGHWIADADGGSHLVDDEAQPFSLVYAFNFR